MSKHDENESEKSELETLKAQAEANLNGWKRAQADYHNLEKEYAARMSKMAEYAAAEMIAKFMPVIDNFELAIAHVPADVKDSEWMKGMYQVQKERDELLKTLDIERIECVGKEFNPHLHEAIGHEPSDLAEGKVTKEVQIGYKMKDRLIRPARVIVSKGK